MVRSLQFSKIDSMLEAKLFVFLWLPRLCVFDFYTIINMDVIYGLHKPSVSMW